MKKHGYFFFGKGTHISQAELAQFKKDTQEMILRGELSNNEIEKRAKIIQLYENPTTKI